MYLEKSVSLYCFSYCKFKIFIMSSVSSHKKMYKMGKDRETCRIEKISPKTKTYNFFACPGNFITQLRVQSQDFLFVKCMLSFWKEKKKRHTFSGSFRKRVESQNQWGGYATCQVLSFLTAYLKIGYELQINLWTH